jgi:hypothetical protein
MSRTAPVVVALALGISAMYPVAQACGDKFLMVGRGAKFQRAYAAVYPGKLVIYVKGPADPKAAIRDPQLHKALRQAGHTVSIIDDWTLLEQAVKTGPVDIILADAADAPRLQPVVAGALAHPDAMYVAFPSKQSTLTDKSLNVRLKSSDRALKYLEEVDNVMKSRSKHVKAAN